MQAARKPPYDLTAEAGVIGSLMLVPKMFNEIDAMLTVDDFFDESHGKIFSAMKTIVATGKPLDPTLIVEQVKTQGDYNKIGGSAYLSKVFMSVPNAAHLTYYAEIVADKALARRVITEATTLLTNAYNEQTEATELVSRFETAAGRLASRSSVSGLPLSIHDSAKILIDRLRNTEATSNTRAFFGVRAIDEKLGPMLGGEVCIVAARTSMGKTSLVQGVMRHSAIQGRPSLLISLEMQHTEIASREISRATSIDSKRIRNNDLEQADLDLMTNAQQSFAGLKFFTWSPSRASFAEIRSYIIHARAKLGISVVGIDYIGLIEEPNKFRGDRREHLAQVSRGLKRLAKELDIPLFVLCQLNREADKERPTLSMLRECGAIEEDADTVLFIYQDDNDGEDHRHLSVAKFRAGAVGDFRLGWDGSRFEFTDPNNEWNG